MKINRLRKNILYFFFLPLFFIFFSCKKETNDPVNPDQTETITIGALLSLTGNWSSLGKTSASAMEFAVNDINNYFNTIDSRFRFSLEVYDTQLDTLKAQQFIAEAKSKVKKFIIGPQSSAEVWAIKKYADENNIIIISHGSTAGNLAIAGDNIYRFCPADSLEGTALANTIYQTGVRGLVTISRNDAGNKGLQSSISTSFTSLGGSTVNLPSYETTVTDFTPQIQQIKNAVSSLTSQHGTGKVGVYIASFDECVNLFKLALNETELNSIKWYGGNGVVQSAVLLADTSSAMFSDMTGFFAPTFGLPDIAASKWQPLSEKIKTQTGINPDAFALASYDALWVIASTIVAARGIPEDINKLKSILVHQANSYYGVTGQTQLNSYGDRSVGSFDYWGIVKTNDLYQWKLIGKSN